MTGGGGGERETPETGNPRLQQRSGLLSTALRPGILAGKPGREPPISLQASSMGQIQLEHTPPVGKTRKHWLCSGLCPKTDPALGKTRSRQIPDVWAIRLDLQNPYYC